MDGGMSLVAGLTGYLLGALPTAAPLGRIWGVRLRLEGSQNPGANNALRLGGPVLALTVLLVEIAKGLAAVRLGFMFDGDVGAVAAAVGAVAGNIYSPWYGFKGGKGLGISAGVLLGTAPVLAVPAIGVLVLVVLPTKSSGTATLAAIGALNASAVVWWLAGWPTGWGIGPGPLLALLTLGMTLVLWPRHHADATLSEPLPQ
jgi:glycerol-3-phosphate acyltransferase PlsY